MATLFAALRENHPPSTVHLSASGHFRAVDEENLIIARSTSLEVYAMRRPDSAHRGSGRSNPVAADADPGEHKDSKAVLQCVGRYDLYGHVEAMVLMKPQGKDRDVLLLVFRDAKMSVVEYNPAADELSTLAIFMFEDEELKRGRATWHTPPVLRVDPRRRCIALLVYESKLIIIPIRHAGEGDLDDDLAQDDVLVQPNKKFKRENASAQGLTRLGAAPPDATGLGFLPSYLIDLEETADLHGAKGIRGVADFTFLEGYYEPTLAFLHENKRTWVGRLAVSHHTKLVTAISLNITQKRNPCIWGASRIPHDCRHLVPLPAPVGGVIIVSSTAVMYRNHGQRSALKFSDYATAAGSGGHRYEAVDDPILFDTVQPVRLDGYQLLFSLKSNEFYALNIHLDADGNTVKSLAVDKVQSVGDSAVGCATSMSRMGSEYLFVGARLGDSALFQIHKVPASSMLDKTSLLSARPGAIGLEGGGAPEMKVEADSVADGAAAVNGEPAVSTGGGEAGVEAGAAAAKGGAAVKPEVESSDDELYGAPATTSPATTTMDVSGEDSDDELYGRGSGAAADAAGAGVGSGATPAGLGNGGVGSGGADDDEMDDEDAAIYAVARAADVSDALMERSELMLYALKQVDKILGLGPVGDFSLCPHRPRVQEVRKDSMDIVTASGGLGQGKVCVMHRALIPVVTTAVSLPNAHAVWTVYADGGDEEEAPAERDTDAEEANSSERMHAYLIISEGGEEPGTVVLKGNELEEFEEDEPMDFHTDGATVCVGNLFARRRIVQVTPWNVLLLKGAVKDQEVPFVAGAGGQIAAAWVHDPYVALLLQDGRMSLLVGDESTMQLNYLNLGGSTEINNVTAACLFANPLLRCQAAAGRGAGVRGNETGAKEEQEAAAQGAGVDAADGEQVAVMLAVAPRSGCLEFYALPSLQMVYRSSDLVLGPQLLVEDAVASADEQLDEVPDPPFIMDMCIQHVPDLGERETDPSCLCLVAITSFADLLVYKSFRYVAEPSSKHSEEAAVSAGAGGDGGREGVKEMRAAMQEVRFKKQAHEIMLRGEAVWEDFFADEMELGDPTREATLAVLRTSRLMPLDDASGVQGILVAARQPALVVFTNGYVRVHPWKLDRNEGVRSSARFRSHAAGRDGIVCIADKGRDKARSMLKICTIPHDIIADSYWPVRTKHIGSTVHHIVYHPPSGCHVIISSVRDDMDEERKPEGSLEGSVPTLVEERYQLQLLAPYSLEVIDTHAFDYANGEQALCLQLVHLKNTRNPDVLLPLLAVGTGFVNGESESSRATGRIYVFEVNEVVGEEGEEGRGSFRIKQLFSSADLQDIKAPVTAMAQLEGYLCVAQGPNPGMIGGSKVYVYEWVEEKLVGRAFHDAHLYISSLKTLKFYIIFGDVHHSLHLLRWREDIRMLQLLARDPLPLSVHACEFIVIGNQLGMVASDDQRNLQIFIFNPNSPDYRRQQLICRADLHAGAHINSFARWPMPLRPQVGVRLAAHFTSVDGAVGTVCPLPQDSYRRLLALQNLLVTAVPHVAGLNPRSWRLFRPAVAMKRRYAKSFLDANLLGRYLHLDLGLQIQLALALRNTRDALLGDLYELLVSTLIS